MFSAYLILIVLGIMGHVLNAFLIYYFTNRAFPSYWKEPERPDEGGKYQWEYTAGKGIVPKWVSWLGILSVLSFAVGGFWGVAIFVRWLLL
jgi:hypothetical protein